MPLKRKRPYLVSHHVRAHFELLPRFGIVGACSICGCLLHGVLASDINETQQLADYIFAQSDVGLYTDGFHMLPAGQCFSKAVYQVACDTRAISHIAGEYDLDTWCRPADHLGVQAMYLTLDGPSYPQCRVGVCRDCNAKFQTAKSAASRQAYRAMMKYYTRPGAQSPVLFNLTPKWTLTHHLALANVVTRWSVDSRRRLGTAYRHLQGDVGSDGLRLHDVDSMLCIQMGLPPKDQNLTAAAVHVVQAGMRDLCKYSWYAQRLDSLKSLRDQAPDFAWTAVPEATSSNVTITSRFQEVPAEDWSGALLPAAALPPSFGGRAIRAAVVGCQVRSAAGRGKAVLQPLQFFDRLREELLFCHLFPVGQGGYLNYQFRVNGTQGQVPQYGIKAYSRLRALSADSRWRRDPRYLFYLFDTCIKHDMAFYRQFATPATALTAGEATGTTDAHSRLGDSLPEQTKQAIDANPLAFFGRQAPFHLPSSNQYWSRRRRELLTMVSRLGKPALYFTFTANPQWPEVLSMQAQHIALGEDGGPYASALPISIAFEMRWKAVFKVMRDVYNPVEWWFRREYQHRGLPHIHGVLWTEQPLLLPRDDDNQHARYDFNTDAAPHGQVIAKPIPAACQDEPWYEQASMVLNTSMKHRCIPARCFKTAAAARDKLCHYRFPRPAQDFYSVATKGRGVNVPRNADGASIVPYVPVLLAVWMGNCNIEVVLENKFVTYLAKYLSKCHPQAYIQWIKYLDTIGASNTPASHYLKSRVASHPEIIDFLLSHSFCRASRTFATLSSVAPIHRVSAYKEQEELLKLAADSTDVLKESFIAQYINRPTQACQPSNPSLCDHVVTPDTMSVVEYREQMQIEDKQPGVLVRRNRGCAPTLDGKWAWPREKSHLVMMPWVSPLHEDRHLRTLILQHVPFRDETILSNNLRQTCIDHGLITEADLEQLLRSLEEGIAAGVSPTIWAETVRSVLGQMVDAESMSAALEAISKAGSAWPEEYRSLLPPLLHVTQQQHACEPLVLLISLLQATYPDDNEQDTIRLAHLTLDETDDDGDFSSDKLATARLLHEQILNRKQHIAGLAETLPILQADQLRAFHAVFSAFLDNSAEGACFLITGPAGTGKSVLIKALLGAAALLNRQTAVTAPTGTAAKNIGGVTLHAAMTWDSHCSMKADANRTGSDFRRILGTNTWIIDEAGMLTNSTLNTLHTQLRKVSSPGIESEAASCLDHIPPFGGRVMIFVGDFAQIEAVEDTFDPNFPGQFYHSPLMNCMKRLKLTQVLRQDPASAQVLSSLRAGSVSDEAFAALSRRVCGEGHPLEHDCHHRLDPKSVVIVSKHSLRAAHNHQRFASLLASDPPPPTATYEAVDTFFVGLRDHGRESLAAPSEKDRAFMDKSDKLDETLVLAVGARVMLVRNMFRLNSKLVNGSLGVVSGLDAAGATVEFDDGLIQRIPRVYTVYFNRLTGNEICRQQLPLTLAWSITCHKVQGWTLNKAYVDTSDFFASGQLYTALTRIKSLSQLHLLNLNREGIFLSLDAQKAIHGPHQQIVHKSRRCPVSALLVQTVPCVIEQTIDSLQLPAEVRLHCRGLVSIDHNGQCLTECLSSLLHEVQSHAASTFPSNVVNDFTKQDASLIARAVQQAKNGTDAEFCTFENALLLLKEQQDVHQLLQLNLWSLGQFLLTWLQQQTGLCVGFVIIKPGDVSHGHIWWPSLQQAPETTVALLAVQHEPPIYHLLILEDRDGNECISLPFGSLPDSLRSGEAFP